MSDWQIYLVVGVFSVVILVIAFDLIDMAVVALVGTSVLIALGIIDPSR
jgi:Na+/H+ antiporter NhaD/arsenite permease-like protein